MFRLALMLTLSLAVGCAPSSDDDIIRVIRQPPGTRGSVSVELELGSGPEEGAWQVTGLSCLLPGGPTDSDLAQLTLLANLENLDLYGTFLESEQFSGVSASGIRRLAALRLRRLNISSYVTEDAAEAVSSLSTLESLQLGMPGSSKKMSDRVLPHLRGLQGLQRLSLAGVNVSDAAFPHILALNNLRELRLGWSVGATDAGLAELKALRNLRLLEVGSIGSSGLSALADLPSLEQLEIAEYRPSAGVADLTRFPHLKWLRIDRMGGDNAGPIRLPADLRRLDVPYSVAARLDFRLSKRLEHVQVGLPGARPGKRVDGEYNPVDLTWVSRLEELRSLTLRRPFQADVKAIASLSSLSDLGLVGDCMTPIGDDGLRALAGLRSLKSLKVEDYYGSGDEGLTINKGMDVLPSLTNLRQLELTGFPGITSESLANVWDLKELRVLKLKLIGGRLDGSVDGLLTHIVGCSNLEELTLSFEVRKKVSDDGLRSLASLKNLRRLDLGNCEGYSDRVLASLMRALPDLQQLKRTLER